MLEASDTKPRLESTDRLYAAAVLTEIDRAAAQGGNASVYLHVFDSWFVSDIWPSLTLGYEVDVTETANVVFRLNTALGVSFP